MFPIALFPDLPGCSIEQVSSTQETIIISLSSTREGATCPDCDEFSSRVHSTYTRSPKTLPSGGRPVRLLLQVQRFRCSQPNCRRKTFAEPFPDLVAPHAQRTFPMQDLLRIIGEAMGGEAGARLSQRLAMKCSRATILRLVCQSPLPSSAHVRVLGVDEWAWRKGQRYGTLLVDLEHHLPIDLLPDETAESFATWLQAHPSVELISRDRGTTFADGANRGAPQALQIADRWHLLHNLGESLEKVLTRHHADLKRVFTLPEEQDQLTAALDQQALTRLKTLSQAEQLRQARREQREAVFMRVQELSAQGWSGASIARMLGIHKKTAVKYAAAEHFPERRDRGHKLALYLPFLQTQWAAGEHNTAARDLAIHAQGYSGSETSVRESHHFTAKTSRTSKTTTTILSARLCREERKALQGRFESSSYLVSLAKTSGSFIRRSTCVGARDASTYSTGSCM